MPKSLGSKFNRDDAAMARGENGIPKQLLENYVLDVETAKEQIKAIMDKAREECEPLQEHINEVIKTAAENGIAKAPLKAKLKERELLRKANSVDENLTPEQKDIFIEIEAKLSLDLFAASPKQEAAE